MTRFSRQAFHDQFLREQCLKKRLARAVFRLEMAELERVWAIVSAHQEGLSLREIAREVGLGPTRVHQLVTGPQAKTVEPALSVLREAGWPSQEDLDPGAEEQVSDRLTAEADLLRLCADGLEAITAGKRPPEVNLRPGEDLDSLYRVLDQNRCLRILRRIAHDLEELARVRRVADLSSTAEEVDPRQKLRRRLAEPPVELSLKGVSMSQSWKAWEDYARQLREAGLPEPPPNPYRHLYRSRN